MLWGFRGEGGHLQDDKKNRYLVIRCLLCYKKLSLVLTSYGQVL